MALVGAAHKSDMWRGRHTSNCENLMQLPAAVSPRPYSSISTPGTQSTPGCFSSQVFLSEQMPFMCANLSHFVGGLDFRSDLVGDWVCRSV